MPIVFLLILRAVETHSAQDKQTYLTAARRGCNQKDVDSRGEERGRGGRCQFKVRTPEVVMNVVSNVDLPKSGKQNKPHVPTSQTSPNADPGS